MMKNHMRVRRSARRLIVIFGLVVISSCTQAPAPTLAGSTTAVPAQSDLKPDLSGNDLKWVKVSNTACWVYEPGIAPELWMEPRFHDAITWNGTCSDRLVSGRGTISWYTPAHVLRETDTGTFSGGAMQGAGSITTYAGAYFEPFYPSFNGAITVSGTFSDGALGDTWTISVPGKSSSDAKTYTDDGTVVQTGDYRFADDVLRMVEVDNLAATMNSQAESLAAAPTPEPQPQPSASLAQAQPSPAAAMSPGGADVGSDVPDPAMLADAANLAAYVNGHLDEFMGGQPPLHLDQDPTAERVDTKCSLGEDYYAKGSGNPMPDDNVYTNDQKFADEQKARYWLTLCSQQLHKEHPEAFVAHTTETLEDGELEWDAGAASQELAKIPDEHEREQYVANEAQQAAQAKADEEQKEARFAAAAARPKHVGDTVCDENNYIVGQVDAVSGDRVRLLVTESHSVYVPGNIFVLGSGRTVGFNSQAEYWYPSNQYATCN